MPSCVYNVITVQYSTISPAVVAAQLDVRIGIIGNGFVNITLEPPTAYLASNCIRSELFFHTFFQSYISLSTALILLHMPTLFDILL